MVRGDVSWLCDQNLARTEKLDLPSGDFWVVHLTTQGEEVAQGRDHPGVARRTT